MTQNNYHHHHHHHQLITTTTAIIIAIIIIIIIILMIMIMMMMMIIIITRLRDYDRSLVQKYFLYLHLFSVRNRVRVSECNSFMLNLVVSKLLCWLCCDWRTTYQSFKIIEDLFHQLRKERNEITSNQVKGILM